MVRSRSFLTQPQTFILLPAVWIILCTVLGYFLVDQEQRNTQTQAYTHTQALFESFRDIRLWNAQLQGVFALESETTQINHFLPESMRTLETRDNKTLVRINPAYMIRQLAPIVKQRGIELHLPGLNPIHPVNQPDPWEKANLELFSHSTQTETFAQTPHDEHWRFRYISALKAEPACLKCHPDRKVGDVLGALSVSFCGDRLLGLSLWRNTTYILIFLALALIGTFSIVLLLKHNRRRLDALSENRDRFRIVSNLTKAVAVDYDVAASSLVLSSYWNQLLGLAQQGDVEMDLQAFYRTVATDDIPRLSEFLQSFVQNHKQQGELELRIERNDGRQLWCLLRLGAVRDQQGTTVRLLGLLDDVDQRMKEKLSLVRRADLDSLTRIYNKGALQQAVDQALRRPECTGYTLLILDIDNFKQINDSFGHLLGDTVLQTTARVLQESFPEHSLCGRFGGDEFIAFIDQKRTVEQLQSICQSLRLKCRQPRHDMPPALIVTLSMGVVTGNRENADFMELLDHADRALYQAKNSGKDGFHIFTDV